jgi:hypothetical protein
MAKRSTRGGETPGGEGLPQPEKKRRAPAKKRADEALPVPMASAPVVRDSAPELSRGYVEPHDEHADDWSPAESIAMSSEPSEEDIRMRAYQRFLDRGAGHGADFDDWILAERELRRR